jgi:hypothetical protein
MTAGMQNGTEDKEEEIKELERGICVAYLGPWT